MDTLGCALVPSTANFLQQATLMLLQRSSSINNKGIRSLARALNCPGVDKRCIVNAVATQIPVWSTGAASSQGTGSSAVGTATQNVLAMLGSRDTSGVADMREILLGDGCLSDPFILSGIYDVILRTPVLKPTTQEFAFASGAKEAAYVYDALFGHDAGEGSAKSGSKKKKGASASKTKGRNASQSTVYVLGNYEPGTGSAHTIDPMLARETAKRIAPLLRKSIDGASSTEFSQVIKASKGGLTLDYELAKSVEEVRERLWHSMYKRGEVMVGMHTGARGARSASMEDVHEHRRKVRLGLVDADAQVRGPDMSASGASSASASYDFSDPDVLSYIWRMICTCQRKERIESLLRRFPMLGNNICHAPVNTNGVGGMGTGAAQSVSLSSKAYCKLLIGIIDAPCRDYLVSVMDSGYIRDVLLASLESSPRESIREWSSEALLLLHRLSPLPTSTLERIVASLAKRPLVALGLPSAHEVFETSKFLVLDPSLEGVVPHLESQLCDAFWNVTRMFNASTVLTGLHSCFYRLHREHLLDTVTHTEKKSMLTRTLRRMLFLNFANRIAQDPQTERSAACQSTFASVAGLLGAEEECELSMKALKEIFAFQQAQHEALSMHMVNARESLLSGPKRHALRELSMNPKASNMPKELLARMTGATSEIAHIPDEGLEADAARIHSYTMRPRLTANSVVQGVVECSGAMKKTLLTEGEVAVPMQQRVPDGEVPRMFSANLLGPREPNTSPQAAAQDYIKKNASARLLATTVLHPRLSEEHGWHSYACAAIVDHFGLRHGAPAVAATRPKSKSKTKKSAVLDENTTEMSSLRSPAYYGYTLPICRALVAHHVLNEKFRTDIANATMGASNASTPKKSSPPAKKPKVSSSESPQDNVNTVSGPMSASIPIILGSADGSNGDFIDSATRCTMVMKRCTYGESPTF